MLFDLPFATTGIGSFPHKNEEKVYPLILQNFPEIPFWPQFPKRSFLEGMVLQFSEGFPNLKWDERRQTVWVDTGRGFDQEVDRFYGWLGEGNLEPFKIKEDFAKGIGFLELLASTDYSKNLRYIKGQITGPVTFGLALADAEQRPIFYEPTLREILIKHLSSKARWMEERFHQLLPGAKTIVSFDEPSLSSFGSAFSGLNREEVIASLNECFDAVNGFTAVHCCGNTDWSVLLSTDLDILSFDAYGYMETLALYPKELGKFLERGGLLAWGIVPTSEEIEKVDSGSLVERFKAGIHDLCQKGVDPTLLQDVIITPSCGTASLPIPLAEKVCRITAEVSRRLRGV